MNLEKMRAQFEEWHKSEFPFIDTKVNGFYMDFQVNSRLIGFMAAWKILEKNNARYEYIREAENKFHVLHGKYLDEAIDKLIEFKELKLVTNKSESSAERTLKMLGYTDCNGELWNPPLRQQPAQEPVSRWMIPTESQILAATEKAGLWPNTVYTWLPAFHRYHAELAKLNQEPVKQESWISVEDRLPKVEVGSYEFFLVTALNLQTHKESVFEAAFLNEMELYSDDHDPMLFSGWHSAKESKDYDGWYEPLGNENCKVTHWMGKPLPPVKEVTG